jgi:hypothetical protein
MKTIQPCKFNRQMWLTLALSFAVTMILTGCVGYVDGGGEVGAAVVAPTPDVFLFGGGYDRGRDVHGYRDRGAQSRGAAHGGDRRH